MQQVPVFEDRTSESINFLQYLVLLWHWLWLIVLAIIIAAVGAYYASNFMPPVYQAKTTVLVDMAPTNKAVDYSSLQMSSLLTQTYSQMISKSPVLNEVAAKLKIDPIDPRTISAKPIQNTQLINITVNSSNPFLAAEIANTMVSVFAEQVQTLQTSRFSASQQSLLDQMTDIDKKIKDANENLANTTIQTEKDRLESMIANYSQTYASLLQSFEQVRLAEAQTRSTIVEVEPAIVPSSPIRPRTSLNIAIAVLVSAILSSGIIIAVDLLNDKVKTPEEIVSKTGLSVLGVISHYKKSNGKPITEAQPLSPITEAFRTLRTNLKYAGAGLDRPLRSYIVTSAMPGEGKTEVLINLGIVLAQNKQRVLLIDADLRRPTLHKRLGLDNYIGLSQIFVNPEMGVTYSLQPTRINGLSAITAGDTPPNPSELLGSQLMSTILETVKNKFDVVLIDTPPVLAVTDAAVILPFVEGVLLVIKPGFTSFAPLRRVINQFLQLNANFLGVVLNDINLRNSSYGYYYRHYKYDDAYQQKKGSKKAKKGVSPPRPEGNKKKVQPSDLIFSMKK